LPILLKGQSYDIFDLWFFSPQTIPLHWFMRKNHICGGIWLLLCAILLLLYTVIADFEFYFTSLGRQDHLRSVLWRLLQKQKHWYFDSALCKKLCAMQAATWSCNSTLCCIARSLKKVLSATLRYATLAAQHGVGSMLWCIARRPLYFRISLRIYNHMPKTRWSVTKVVLIHEKTAHHCKCTTEPRMRVACQFYPEISVLMSLKGQ
jgi:hypothetical protein